MNDLKTAISLFDESLKTADSKDIHASLQLSHTGLTYCLIDNKNNQVLALESIPIKGLKAESVKEAISGCKLKDIHPGSADVALVSPISTLVPSPLYDENKKETILRFNHGDFNNTGEIFTDLLKNVDARNVYFFPAELVNIFKGITNRITFSHYTTTLIDSLLLKFKNDTKKRGIVHVQDANFEVIVVNKGKLIYFNTFRNETTEDFAYYILNVLEQLKLNPEEINITLLGEFEKNSALYAILYTYIKHLAFGKRPEQLKYSYKLEELPAHFYYTLFNQHLCVL